MNTMLRHDDPDVDAILAQPRSGWLYAIVAPTVKQVKIGHAQDVSRRLLDFQTGSPAEITLHSATLEHDVVVAEAQAHLALSHARLSGEWFELTDHDVDQWLAARETDV